MEEKRERGGRGEGAPHVGGREGQGGGAVVVAGVAFGVVLLELLMGRKPVEKMSPSQCQSIVSWVISISCSELTKAPSNLFRLQCSVAIEHTLILQ